MKKWDLVIASGNKHKIAEFREMLRDCCEVCGMRDLGFAEDIPETGQSFIENARLKAEALATVFPDRYVVADDSGLCCDLLDGAPGIFSARFGGTDQPYGEKIAALQALLREKNPDPSTWTAHFTAALCLAEPGGGLRIFEEYCEGRILPESRGEGGFGYDPVLYREEEGKTLAEMSPEEKNRISHRGKALRALLLYLRASRGEDGK